VTLLLLSLLLSATAAVWVALPLIRRRAAMLADLEPGAVLDAEARRRVRLAALRELEYDYIGGKLDDADYRSQRERLSLDALAAIRDADAVSAGAASDRDGGAAGGERPVDATAPHACGFVNEAGSGFCAGCGARLG
jgi:hypothetical protein